MNSDFKDLLQMLQEEQVEYLVVGGYAVIHHSQPRFTKDLDIWLRPTKENALKVARTFRRFGIPLIGVTIDDFADTGLQYAVGQEPSMIDFLTSIPGLDFDKCWESRVKAKEDNFQVIFLGKKDLITSKKTAGRLQDLADIDELNRANPC